MYMDQTLFPLLQNHGIVIGISEEERFFGFVFKN